MSGGPWISEMKKKWKVELTLHSFEENLKEKLKMKAHPLERKNSDYVLSEAEAEYIASKNYKVNGNQEKGFPPNVSIPKQIRNGNSQYTIYSDGRAVSIIPENVDKKCCIASEWKRSLNA